MRELLSGTRYRVQPPTPPGCYFLFLYLLLPCESLDGTPSTRAHPQLRWIHCSSKVTLHTRTLQPPALLPLTTCPTTALLLTSNLPLTLSRLGTFSTIPMMIQLSTTPGNNLIIRSPIKTQEVLSCRSSTTPTPFARIYPTLTTTRMVVSTLPGLTSPGLLTPFNLPSTLNTTTSNNNNGTTRP